MSLIMITLVVTNAHHRESRNYDDDNDNENNDNQDNW